MVVMQWISIVLCLTATIINLRAWDKWKRMREQLKAKERFCSTMINLCVSMMESKITRDLTTEQK